MNACADCYRHFICAMTTGLPPGRVETGTTFNCFVKDFWQHVAVECNFAVKNKSLYIVLV